MKYQAHCKTCGWLGRTFHTSQAAECEAASHELVARHYTHASVRRVKIADPAPIIPWPVPVTP